MSMVDFPMAKSTHILSNFCEILSAAGARSNAKLKSLSALFSLVNRKVIVGINNPKMVFDYER